MSAPSRHNENPSRVYSRDMWDVYDVLDVPLDPRGPDMLHDIAARYLSPGARVLDAGCRDAEHLVRLVEDNDVTGVGIDPVAWHIERAEKVVADAGLDDKIELHQVVMQDVPYPDEHFDLVWCRDVLEQVDDLDAALRGTARVLRRGGAMLVYTVFATDAFNPFDAEVLGGHLGNVPENLVPERVEHAFADAGLVVEYRQAIGTEWREHAEERHRPVSRALLRLARLRRQRDDVVARFGRDVFDHVHANLHWEVYQFLGKLEPVVYLLRRAEAGA